MAINLGNYGQEVVQGQLTQQQPDISVGGALTQLGQQFSQMAQNDIVQLQQARIGSLMAKQGTDLHKIKIDLYDKVRMGAVKSEDVASEYSRLSKEYQDVTLADQDETIQRLAAPAMEQYSVRSQADVYAAQQTFIKQDSLALFNETLGDLNAMAQYDPAGHQAKVELLFDTLGKNTGIAADDLQKMKASTVQEGYVSERLYYTNNAKDPAELEKEAAKWDSPDYLTQVSDPSTRVSVQRSMLHQADRLRAEQQAKAREGVAAANDMMRQYIQIAEGGQAVPVGPELLTKMQQASAAYSDTPLGKQLGVALSAYASARQLDHMPLAESSTLIDQQKRFMMAADSPEGRAKAEAKYNALVSGYNANLKLYNSAGAYAYYTAKTGEQVPRIDFNTDAQGMLAQLAERKRYASKVESITGYAPGLIQKDEIKDFQAVLEKQSDTRIVDFVKGVIAVAPEQAAATFEQMGKGMGPAYAAIGAAAQQQARLNTGADLANLMARGIWLAKQPQFDSLKVTKSDVPGQTADQRFGAIFDEQTDNLFNQSGVGDAASRQMAIDLSKYTYYALMESTARKDNEFNKEVWASAVKSTLGPVVEFNGRKTITNNYYMTQPKFQKNGQAALDAMGQAMGFSDQERKQLKTKANLIPAGSSNGNPVYRVLYNGRLIIEPESRQPVTVFVGDK